LKVDELIPFLPAIGFAYPNVWVECGNAMCFHLESMDGARNKGSLVTFAAQKSVVCLPAEKKLTDRCITNILSAPKGQRMLEEKMKGAVFSPGSLVHLLNAKIFNESD
jgi:hypothetical protein